MTLVQRISDVLSACNQVICKLETRNFVKRVSVDYIVDEHAIPPTGLSVA